MPASPTGPVGIVAAAVRRDDPDRYIASLYAPRSLRPSLWAVYGLAAELAQVAARVSQGALGEIRLQWWRQTLDDVCEDISLEARDDPNGLPRGHPVAEALGPVVTAHPAVLTWLRAMIDGRIGDLYADPMDNMPALEAYFGETLSLPIRVAIHLLAPEADERAAADAAGHGGVAIGLARMASFFSVVLQRRPELIPLEILESRELTIAELRSGPKRHKEIIMDLHSAAMQHLDGSVLASRALPAAALPAVLPLAPLRSDLRLIANRTSQSVEPVRRGSVYRQWSIWRAARRGAIL